MTLNSEERRILTQHDIRSLDFTTKIADTFTANGDVKVANSLKITSASMTVGTLKIGTLQVSGDIYCAGGLVAGTDESPAQLQVDGATTVTGKTITMKNGYVVEGSLTVTGECTTQSLSMTEPLVI